MVHIVVYSQDQTFPFLHSDFVNVDCYRTWRQKSDCAILLQPKYRPRSPLT